MYFHTSGHAETHCNTCIICYFQGPGRSLLGNSAKTIIFIHIHDRHGILEILMKIMKRAILGENAAWRGRGGVGSFDFCLGKQPSEACLVYEYFSC